MEYKLGKLLPKKDERTLKLNKFLKALPPIPDEYDYDSDHKVPTPMFANDRFRDCVIAGRGHQTLRFELTEQGKVISITDKDITYEYFKETLGRNSGLSVLDSLKLWRKDGWKVDDKTYDIYVFAGVDPKDHREVTAAVYLLTGIRDRTYNKPLCNRKSDFVKIYSSVIKHRRFIKHARFGSKRPHPKGAALN